MKPPKLRITALGLELTPMQAEEFSDVMAVTATAIENRYRIPTASGARLSREPSPGERQLAAEIASEIRPRSEYGNRPVLIGKERLGTVKTLSTLVLENADVVQETLRPYYASPEYEGLVVPDAEDPVELVAAIHDAIASIRQ